MSETEWWENWNFPFLFFFWTPTIAVGTKKFPHKGSVVINKSKLKPNHNDNKGIIKLQLLKLMRQMKDTINLRRKSQHRNVIACNDKIKPWNVNITMNKKFSFQLSHTNRLLRRVYTVLDQLLHGILIFVSVISQQGEWRSREKNKALGMEKKTILFF